MMVDHAIHQISSAHKTPMTGEAATTHQYSIMLQPLLVPGVLMRTDQGAATGKRPAGTAGCRSSSTGRRRRS